MRIEDLQESIYSPLPSAFVLEDIFNLGLLYKFCFSYNFNIMKIFSNTSQYFIQDIWCSDNYDKPYTMKKFLSLLSSSSELMN